MHLHLCTAVYKITFLLGYLNKLATHYSIRMCIMHWLEYLKLNISDGVVSKYLLFYHQDIKWTITLSACALRPVLFTFLRFTFLDIGNHGNNSDLLLPHHLPKVSECVQKWTYRKGKKIFNYIPCWTYILDR